LFIKIAHFKADELNCTVYMY